MATTIAASRRWRSGTGAGRFDHRRPQVRRPAHRGACALFARVSRNGMRPRGTAERLLARRSARAVPNSASIGARRSRRVGSSCDWMRRTTLSNRPRRSSSCGRFVPAVPAAARRSTQEPNLALRNWRPSLIAEYAGCGKQQRRSNEPRGRGAAMTLEQRRNDGIDLRVRDEGTDRTAVRLSRFPPPPDQTPWAHRPGPPAARTDFRAEDVSARHVNGCGPNIGRNAEVQMRIETLDRRGSHRDAIPSATGVRLGEVHAHCCVARQAKGKRSVRLSFRSTGAETVTSVGSLRTPIRW